MYLVSVYYCLTIIFLKSESVTPDSSGQLKVSRHYRHPSRVDGAQVGVFEQRHEVSLCSLLKGQHCRRLESELLLELVG